MPKPLSIDLRERILKDVLGGMNYADAGRKYSVSAEFVRRFHRRYEATQEIAPRPPIPRVVPFYRKHEATIRAAVAERLKKSSDRADIDELRHGNFLLVKYPRKIAWDVALIYD